MGILLLPLVSLEEQVAASMTALGIKFVCLGHHPVTELKQLITDIQPHVLLTNVETLDNSEVQREISQFSINYIAIDEAQVSIGDQLKCRIELTLVC
jgi:superfamily II DNA helicase RecQ